MVFKKFFGKEDDEPHYDPSNIRLTDLEIGFMLDYDLKTFEVVAHYEYDWGDNWFSDEFKLQNAERILYLHLEEDDELEISIHRKLKLKQVSENIRQHFQSSDDPPETLTYEGTTYTLEEEAPGSFRTVPKEHWTDFLSWTYEDESGDTLLTLERWSEDEFELSYGEYVEEHEFSNLLPSQ